MKFKNQVGELGETSDDCLTPGKLRKLRDHEEIKTEKKIIKNYSEGNSVFFLTFDQASLKQKGMKDRLIAGWLGFKNGGRGRNSGQRDYSRNTQLHTKVLIKKKISQFRNYFSSSDTPSTLRVSQAIFVR